MSSHYDYLFKIHLIGDSGVGKTCLLHRFAEDHFPDPCLNTFGIDFRIKTIILDNEIVRLLIWDIPGLGIFRLTYRSFFRGAYGVMFVYDVTDRESFDDVRRWLLEIDKYASNNVHKLLVGNKCDLVGEKVVDYTTAKEYADSLNMPFIETSAKCAVNVEQAFVVMASQIKNNFESKPQNTSDPHNNINLNKKLRMSRQYDFLFKMHLIGDSGVGKSSLIRRFAEDIFSDSYMSPVGIYLKIKTITLDDKRIKLQIWDVISHGPFHPHYASYYRGTHGFIFVYDVTDRESFDHIPYWLLEIERCASDQVPGLLVGNKCDLIDRRVVDYSTAKEYADSLNMPFLETSAKCAVNVEQAFVMMASQIKNGFESKTQIPSDPHDNINLNKKVGMRQSSCCC